MTDSAENDAALDIIAGALAEHREGYEADDLPTEYHGYAAAVMEALESAGYRVIPPAEKETR